MKNLSSFWMGWDLIDPLPCKEMWRLRRVRQPREGREGEGEGKCRFPQNLSLARAADYDVCERVSPVASQYLVQIRARGA